MTSFTFDENLANFCGFGSCIASSADLVCAVQPVQLDVLVIADAAGVLPSED